MRGEERERILTLMFDWIFGFPENQIGKQRFSPFSLLVIYITWNDYF
jgi:hypothetical protein